MPITKEQFKAIKTEYDPVGVSLEEFHARLSPPRMHMYRTSPSPKKNTRKLTPSPQRDSPMKKKNTRKRKLTPSPQRNDDFELDLPELDGGKKKSKSRKSRSRKSNKSKK